MEHVRGAPYHPQKIEPWHQTLKNHILLENYRLPGATPHVATPCTGVLRRPYLVYMLLNR